MVGAGMDLFMRGLVVGFSLGAACALSLAHKFYNSLPETTNQKGKPAVQ